MSRGAYTPLSEEEGIKAGQGDLQVVTCDALYEHRLDLRRAPLVLDRADADGDGFWGNVLNGRVRALAVDLGLQVVVHQTRRYL
jgi:hypothetical protein